MERVVRGDNVQVLCQTKLDDGTFLGDEADRDRPLWLKAGQRMKTLQPITDALIGMQIGERKSFVIEPSAAFGAVDADKIFRVGLSSLPRVSAVGDVVRLARGAQAGDVLILSVERDTAVVDGNHPLAGCSLHVELELLAINR